MNFFIIRADDPYVIYATRELAEKQLQRIIDIQHNGNVIIKKDIEVNKTVDGKLDSVIITAYKRDIVGREYVAYSIKYAIEDATLVEEEDKHDNQ